MCKDDVSETLKEQIKGKGFLSKLGFR